MDIDLDAPACIDPTEHKELLSDLQGNILKGHGREHMRLVLLQFTAAPSDARAWVRMFGGGWTTPASAQDRQAADWRNKTQDSLFANLFLTFAGYRYLEVPDASIPGGNSFRAGMRGSRQALNDPPPEEWEANYQIHPVHAMMLLATSTPAHLEDRLQILLKSLAGIATITQERGLAMRQTPEEVTPESRYVEHFNYLDGSSQPLFYRKDLEAAAGKRSRFDPAAPLGLVLVKEPTGPKDRPTGYGSFLVYRKLEQNVRGFKERQRDLAAQLGLSDEARSKVGAMVIGRFENGTPLALASQAELPDAPNDFNYVDDPAGKNCPLFAHIRKVNPRTDESRAHRIARRGMTYDDVGRKEPPSNVGQAFDQMPTKGVGLLFMCFQGSIENQFEYLQLLANGADLPVPGSGVDPLAGQVPAGGGAPACASENPTKRFGSFVKLMGGEYFFAPSRSFFKKLPD